MGLMLRGFTKVELLNQRKELSRGQGAVAPGEGIVMITDPAETGITGGEAAAEVMISMNVVIGTVGETGIIVAEAGAAVPVWITKVVEGGVMMMSLVEAGADQWIAAPLHAAVLVLEEVLPLRGVFPLKGALLPGKVHGVKVLIIVAVMDGLLHLAVSHHVAALLLREAHPLESQMVMNKLFLMKNSRDALTSVPVAVLLVLDHLVNVNGLISHWTVL